MQAELSNNNLCPELDIRHPQTREAVAVMSEATRLWSPKIFDANVETLEQALKVIEILEARYLVDDGPIVLKNKVFPVLTLEPRDIKESFNAYRNSAQISTSLGQEMSYLPGQNPQHFTHAEEGVVSLTSEHDYHFGEIDALLKQKFVTRPKEIAVLVWDSHVDGLKKGEPIRELHKATFLHPLCSLDVQVGITGLDQFATEYISKTGLPLIYSDRPRLKRQTYEQKQEQIVHKDDLAIILTTLAAKGAKYLIHSVDVDVLRSWIPGETPLTAFEYNHIATLTALGYNQIFKQLAAQGFKYPNAKVMREEMLKLKSEPKIKNWLNALLNSLNIIRRPQTTDTYQVKQKNTFGLSLDNLLQGIDWANSIAQQNNMQVGVPLANGRGRYLGGVTELCGLDLEGKTAQTALKIAGRMLSGAR